MSFEMADNKILDSSVLEGLRVYAKSGTFLQQVIEIFEQHGHSSLEELCAAADSQDLETVRRVAHRLKGSCLNVGATLMAKKLKNLEQLCGSNQSVEHALSLVAELPSILKDTCKALKSIL